MKLEALVARFGGMSPDEIAEFLCANGCFGHHKCINCPLARHFSREMGERVSVGPNYIRTKWDEELVIPFNILQFMGDYDNHHRYSFLAIA